MKHSNGSLVENAVLWFIIGVLSSALGFAIRELKSSKDELSKICVSLGQMQSLLDKIDTSHKIASVLEQEPRQMDEYEQVCRSLDKIGAAGPSYVSCDFYEQWACNRTSRSAR